MPTMWACLSSDWRQQFAPGCGQVELHSKRTGDLRRNLIRLVRALRFCFPHLPELQQNRKRLHLRFANGSVRAGREFLAFV